MKKLLRYAVLVLTVACGTHLTSRVAAREPAAQTSAAEGPAAEGPMETFEICEAFGIDHSEQIIDFDLKKPVDPQTCHLLGPEGREVAWQLLDGGKRLAVRTDLPAGTRKTWKLMPGRPRAAAGDVVVVKEVDGGCEIVNGLTGVRIPAVPRQLRTAPAPIQGVRLRDGVWTATGPNVLSVGAKKMTVRWLERGPLKTVVEIGYVLDRPELMRLKEVVVPAGDGFYRTTIELQAGQPSILVETETDCDVSYSLNVQPELHPTQARYQGHHATAVELGREADGKKYRMWHERPNQDALLDLTFDRPQQSRRMAIWDPWVYDSGWYWMLYDAKAAESADVLGFFAGRASRACGCGTSGVSLTTDKNLAAIRVECNRRNPNTLVYPQVRFHWGIFVGTKGRDLAATDRVQTINRQMNLHGGLNLNKVHRYRLQYPDPPQGYGAMYEPRSALDRMMARLRADAKGKHGGGYYSHLYSADSYAREMVDFWFDPSAAAATKASDGVCETARQLLDALVNGFGIYDFHYHYWHGGLQMTNQTTWIDQLLAVPATSPDDRARLKAAAALFGYVMWDDDFVPLFDGHGLNLGNPNMPVNQRNGRNLFAVLLAGHPMMHQRVENLRALALADLTNTVNESGAHMGSVHYVGASMYPLLGSLQQLKMLGRYDAFREEDRLARFAEFYMNFLTPPEVRFGGKRKLVAIGDGSTEGTAMFGQLAAGFTFVRPDLSSRLMGAWNSVGNTHVHFQGSSYLKTDEQLPAADPKLAGATFPGWYSVLRYGWGTPQETALWLVNGDFYMDHCHNDNGNVVIYALGAPLSIDWGPIYYPHVSGGFMHNVVLPESALGCRWDQDDVPLAAGPRYGKATQESFRSVGSCQCARASYRLGNDLTWTRAVQLIHANSLYPILVLRDTFDGPKATAPKVFSLNLMAEGPVETPSGKVSPPLRIHPRQATTDGPGQLPSAGKVLALAPGVNRFGFIGQQFGTPQSPALAIDWDLYTLSAEPQQAQIGNWAHRWHPSTEEGEFTKSQGRPFEERQHILRIRGSGPFTTVILPWRKGHQRNEARVAQQDGKIVITAPGDAAVTVPLEP